MSESRWQRELREQDDPPGPGLFVSASPSDGRKSRRRRCNAALRDRRTTDACSRTDVDLSICSRSLAAARIPISGDLRFVSFRVMGGGRSRTRRDRGRAKDRSQERSQIVFHLLSFSRTIFRTSTVLFISILNPVMRKTSCLTFGFLSSPPRAWARLRGRTHRL